MYMDLGVKGANATIGALGEASKGILNLGSMSFEAKAAVVGLFYTLEKLFAITGQQGVALTNMNTVTGMSIKSLQQYQYALKQVGGTAAEMDQTFKGLQDSITNMIFGEGAPKRLLAVVSQLKGAGIQIFDNEQLEWAKHPEKLLKRLQQYAQLSNVPIFEKRNFLKSFGLGDNVIAALEKNMFRADVFAKAATYSDKTVAELNASAIAWSDVADKFEHAFGLITAKFGKNLADDFGKLVDPIAHLTTALLSLSDSVKLMPAVGKVFEGFATAIDLAHGKLPGPAKTEMPSLKHSLTRGPLGLIEWVAGQAGAHWDQLEDMHKARTASKYSRSESASTVFSPNIRLEQTFNGKADPPKVQDAASKGINDGLRTSAALNTGT